MDNNKVNRRDFLRTGMYAAVGFAGSALIAKDAIAARDAKHAFKVFDETQAALVDAITARLIPTTDTPGAREAGVIYYLDLTLAGPNTGMQGPLFAGLSEFNAAVTRETGESFEDLSEDRQDDLLRRNETEPFFAMLRAQTLLGFFAMEKHGGNRDHISWKLIDFDGHGPRTYPFGYYDAKVHGGEFE